MELMCQLLSKFFNICMYMCLKTILFAKKYLMMNKTLIFLFVLATAFVNAQSKVGTINTDVILSQMPELKGVESEMKAYGKELDSDLRKKYQDYQKLVEKFEEEEADLNDVMKKFRVNEITDLEEDIQKFQQNSQQLIRAKQDELLRPLYTKIGNALEKVVEDEKFTQIFNEGSNLVFISPEYDVTEKVMVLLGLNTDILKKE